MLEIDLVQENIALNVSIKTVINLVKRLPNLTTL